MQETLHDLKTRRSVRAYKPEQVPVELLEQVLEAGVYAPTASGRQSPVIVAVQDKQTRDLLSRLNAEVMGGKSDPFYGAPTVLVVLADSSRATYALDGASVITTLLNAAHAVGLASCWINRAKEELETEEGKALLKKWGLGEQYVGVGHCILGYGDGEPNPPAPRKSDYVIRV